MWQDSILHPPPDVVDLYEAKLREMDLLDQTLRHDGSRGIYGGESQSETHKHFAKRYLNSVTRVQYVLLDPHDVFAQISRDLFAILSSHHVLLVDIPCGAGAGALSVLGTLKELRSGGVLPTTPLTVRIFGADFSLDALKIYESQVNQIKPTLAEIGVDVSLITEHWDASNIQQTDRLMNSCLQDNSYHEYFVLITNFSGAIARHFEKFNLFVEYILARLSNATSTVLWVEPGESTAGPLFSWLAALIDKSFKMIFRNADPATKPMSREFDWRHPVQNKTIQGIVTVCEYKRA